MGGMVDGFVITGEVRAGFDYSKGLSSSAEAAGIPQFEFTVGPLLALAAAAHRVHQLAPTRPKLHALWCVVITTAVFVI